MWTQTWFQFLMFFSRLSNSQQFIAFFQKLSADCSIFLFYLFQLYYLQFLAIFRSCIRRRGSFGYQPGIFCVTQLMNNENMLFSNLNSTFQNQFCVSFKNKGLFLFYNKNLISYEGFDLENISKNVIILCEFLQIFSC